MKKFVRLIGMALVVGTMGVGCARPNDGRLVEKVIGSQGLMPGQFVKPRAIAIDRAGRLAVVDFRAMIQWLDGEGKPLAHWETPTHRFGRPSGLGVDPEGNLLVADSHYHRVLVYDAKGEVVRTYGGDEGEGPLVGRFGYIADVEADNEGSLFIAESQKNERITKIDRAGNIVGEWGGLGSKPGEFQRIRSMVWTKGGELLVADACNHRVQVFRGDGTFLREFGSVGSAAGEMSYPYDLAVARDGTIYVCEYGNSRVQKFSPAGKSRGIWGKPGRGVGELWNPWALGLDPQDRLYVVDSNNHRVLRVDF